MKKQVRKADQAKVRQRKHIAFRMNFLFFSIFVLFSLLIFRLGYLQIVKGEEYRLLLERTEDIAINTSVPRGRIFDREGHVLVDNEPKNAITYTKMSSTSSKDMLTIAEKLAVLIDQDTVRTTIADKKDFWILNNRDAAINKVSKEEIKELEADSSLSRTDVQRAITRLTRERITDEEFNSLTDDELEVLAIYREMTSGYAFSPQIVKSGNVTEEEFAAVSERLDELPGVNTTTDWDRVRKSYNTILGTTTNPTQGIPKSHLNYYLWRDYSRNDRVGSSFIEQQYEELLKGQKTIVKNIKDRSGRVIETKTVKKGEPGKDLVLTIDSELQQYLEEVVSNKLLELKMGPNASQLDRAFLIMMDPNNGEVLSLVGKYVVTNKETGKYEIRDNAYSTFTTTYEVGSTIKMATLLAGYEHGGASIGEKKIDEPLKIKSTAVKSSVFNRTLFSRIPVSDIEAIGRSSNVYMFKIAIAIANSTYRYEESLLSNNSSFDSAFDKMRASYSSFGLGVKTGIDLPGEVMGNIGKLESGKLLDLAIGQYDTYSPIQLAQYVSTIANGGYRIAPKLLKEIHEPSPDGKTLGPLLQESKTVVLNRIANTDQEIEQVKRGMYHTYYGSGGTATSTFRDAPYEAAGKTGTAQAFSGGWRTLNLTHVGFAPYENPEIAYAVIIPHVSTTSKTDYPNNELARIAVDKYFELKAKRAAQQDGQSTVQQIKPPLDNAN